MEANQLEQIKQAMSEIPHLRSLRYSNYEFPDWKNKVLKILEATYGKGAVEYNRFVNAPGTVFITRTENGLQQDYLNRLENYEEALQSLVVK